MSAIQKESLVISNPSNLQKGFQRFECLRNFCVGVRTDLGYGLGVFKVKSYPGLTRGAVLECALLGRENASDETREPEPLVSAIK